MVSLAIARDNNLTKKGVLTHTIKNMINQETCPKCRSSLFYRVTKRGDFVGSTNYPKCDYHRPLRPAEWPDFNRYLNSKKRHTNSKPSVQISSLPERSSLDLQSIN